MIWLSRCLETEGGCVVSKKSAVDLDGVFVEV